MTLEDERRFLLDSLRDLEREHDKGEISDADYDTLRDDYTTRAAAVLRAIEDARASRREAGDLDDGDGQDAAARPHRPTQRRGRRLVAWIVLSTLLIVPAAVLFAALGGRSSGRPEPTTPAGRLALAHQYDNQGRALDALKLYDAVLRDQPANVEALTYRGWLLKRAGLIEQAQASLDRAIAVDPTYPDAHFFRGMLLYQDRKDPAAAIPEFERFLASDPPPETLSAVRGVLERARRDLETPPSTQPPG